VLSSSSLALVTGNSVEISGKLLATVADGTSMLHSSKSDSGVLSAIVACFGLGFGINFSNLPVGCISFSFS
jgi:hypothetical protein